jgi:hypothetical protein
MKPSIVLDLYAENTSTPITQVGAVLSYGDKRLNIRSYALKGYLVQNEKLQEGNQQTKT